MYVLVYRSNRKQLCRLSCTDSAIPARSFETSSVVNQRQPIRTVHNYLIAPEKTCFILNNPVILPDYLHSRHSNLLIQTDLERGVERCDPRLPYLQTYLSTRVKTSGCCRDDDDEATCAQTPWWRRWWAETATSRERSGRWVYSALLAQCE